MLISVAFFVLTFVVPLFLTLQALQFYLESSKEEGANYDNLVSKLLIPWIRYWLCIAILQFLINLPLIRHVIDVLPLSHVGLGLFKLWLYLPKFQGSKILVDGVVLSSFEISNKERRVRLNCLQLADFYMAFALDTHITCVSKIQGYPFLSNLSIFKSIKFRLLELNVSVKEKYKGSTLSAILFMFVDQVGNLEELKSGVADTISRIRSTIDNRQKYHRSVSMPVLNETPVNRTVRKRKSYGSLGRKL